MKRVRFHNSDFELSGYTNLHLKNGFDLDALGIDDGELEELVFEHILEYVSVKAVEDMLAKLCRKVKKGGTVRVVGTDILEVSKLISSYRMDLQNINKTIFNEQPDSSETKKCVFTVNHIASFFNELLKFKVLKQRINGVEFLVEAERQ